MRFVAFVLLCCTRSFCSSFSSSSCSLARTSFFLFAALLSTYARLPALLLLDTDTLLWIQIVVTVREKAEEEGGFSLVRNVPRVVPLSPAFPQIETQGAETKGDMKEC